MQVLGGIVASNPSREGSGPLKKHCEVVIHGRRLSYSGKL